MYKKFSFLLWNRDRKAGYKIFVSSFFLFSLRFANRDCEGVEQLRNFLGMNKFTENACIKENLNGKYKTRIVIVKGLDDCD